jgi:very-short-patch-repair endonuclease
MPGKTQSALLALLNAEPKAWHRAELIRRFSVYALKQLVREGTVVRVLPGIYASPTWQHSCETRLSAVNLWAPKGTAVTGPAGAFLWKLTEHKPSRIDVICAQPLHLTGPPWLRLHRTTIKSRHYIVKGVRVQGVADVLLRTWCVLPSQDSIGLIIDAIRDGIVTARGLRERSSFHPRLKRRRELVALLRKLEDGIDSYLEYIAATTVFHGKEFAQFKRQVQVRAGGRKYILDMFDAGTRVAVELDSAKHHSGDSARRHDIERDANISSVGILTLRFTYEDITLRPEWCRDKVRRTVATRARTPLVG